MDFDDLEEAATAAIEAGDESAIASLGAVEPPGKWNGMLMNRMPHDLHLPGREQLPEKVRGIVKEPPEMAENQVRLFIFYGGGDSYVMWCQTLNFLPSWIDIGVHEYPGHGLRDDEPLSKDLFELSDDAWEAVKPVLKRHAKGGLDEGAPWAILGHSQGILQMVEVAAHARRELGLDPCAVFVLDRPPPGPMGLTKKGYDLLCEKWPVVFYELTQPRLGKQLREQADKPAVKKIGLMWQNDMRIFNEAHTQRPVGFHTFRCDIEVFTADQNWIADRSYFKCKEEGTLDKIPQETLDLHLKIDELHASGEGSAAYFCREDYNLWSQWTTEKANFHTMDIDHNGLKGLKPAWEIIMKVLKKGIDTTLHGKKVFG